MAVSAKWFGKALLNQFGATPVNWTSDTIKVALCTSSFTPDQDVMDFYDDLTNELPSANGYTAGGATLANCAKTYTAGTNVIKLDADDVTWASSTITARYAVIYKDTGTPSTSPLMGYVDFGTDYVSTGGPFVITWDAAGIFTITPA